MTKLRALLLSAAAVCVCGALTGCGESKINLNDYVDFNSNGYDGIGTAACRFDEEKMIKDNPAAFGLKDGNVSGSDLRGIEFVIDGKFSGSLDKNSSLSNGDKITYHWDITDLSAVEEKYPVKFTYEDISYDISDLKKAEVFDPFADINVTFTGYSPNGTVNIDSNDYSISYEADKYNGLKNGETIVITASLRGGEEAYCEQYGKIPSVTEKEYTVEGLSAYATKIDEISEDIQNKMKKQSEDNITVQCSSWKEGNTLKNLEFIGYYFLSPKEGFQTNPNNEIYCIYKVTANLKGCKADSDAEETGEDSYFTYCRFSNILNLADGTCSVDLSAGQTCTDRCDSIYGSRVFGFSPYYFNGFKDLDSMFNKCVTSKVDKFNYENTVK